MSLKKFFWWLPFGSAAEVSVDELKKMMNDGNVQLLDVRTPNEWNDGHIKGAINVPIGEFKSRIGSLELNGGKPIVAICLSAHRSIPAVRVLLKNGFKDAVQLQGGMKAWRAANGEEVKG